MRGILWTTRLALALAILALGTFAATAADEKKDDKPKEEKPKDDKKPPAKVDPDVIWIPTPQKVVDRMLEAAKVGDKSVVYDLGCGDGRIVISAAKKGAKAVGVDIDPDRIKESNEALKKEKDEVKKLVTFKQEDMFKTDLSDCTVLTLYLLPELNDKLVPQIAKMKAGSVIVSHAFDFENYKADETIVHKTEDGHEYDIFIYKLPLKPIKK